MENHESLIGSLFEKTEHYAKATVELYKLKAIDKSADIISTFIARLIVVLCLTLFFVLLNIGIALWIGEALGKSYYGFFMVAGIYALGGILLHAYRNKWVKMPIQNSVLTQVLN